MGGGKVYLIRKMIINGLNVLYKVQFICIYTTNKEDPC